MPHFVPVYDPERPRAEQNAADPALRVHRRWETPHALLSAVAREDKDDRTMKLKPVRSHMIRNEKGLWVPTARMKAEAARREQQEERVRRKWGGESSWPNRERQEIKEEPVLGEARPIDEYRRLGRHAGESGTGKDDNSEQSSAVSAAEAAAADGKWSQYSTERSRERRRSPSFCVISRPDTESDNDSLRERRTDRKGTPLYYERETSRNRFAAEDAQAHTKATSSYYRREISNESDGLCRRRDIYGSGKASEFQRGTRDHRSRSNSPSSARCGHTHARDDRRTPHEQQRYPTHGREVTLKNVTAPSGKIDIFDYMTKKQKALLKQQLPSQSALPSRR